jgi:hypothetical protein
MGKLILISVVISIILLPALAARDPNPQRGLKRTVVGWIVFNFVYLLMVRFIYTRLI